MHSASLSMVEVLLHEFYQPTTTNTRKREIETNLIAFKSQPEAWQLCLRVASDSNNFNENQFLWFFSTSTLEHTITRRWAQLSTADRTCLRDTLWHTYAQLYFGNATTIVGNANNVSAPTRRQRDTLAQLISLMGKREFPDEHANYMNHCIELIKTRFNLGINLLRTTSEEVVSNREDINSERKQYFYSCISMCIPDVMDLLTKCLLIAVCHINGKDVHTIPSTLIDFSLTSALPNDNQLSSSILELLTCVQHLVSWIRIELISEYFLMSILDLSQWRPAHAEISLGALSVLNELLYLQKALPYATTLMSGVNGLLEQHNISKQQSEIYSDKFRELLRLYMNKYATKMLQEYVLLENFLKSLYCCTIQKNGALDFTEKLEIWTPIIRGLAQNPKINRYNDIVHQLVIEIMRRTQFAFNKTELELLDNELIEDNTLTEWQQFLDQCAECISLIAETRPNAVFAQVVGFWTRPHVYLLSIEHALDTGRSYEIARKVKCQTFNEHLRDFSTVCQIVVRITPLLDADAPDVGAETQSQFKLLTDNLLTSLKFLASNKITSLDVDKTTFQTDYDYLYAQIIMAIRSMFPISDTLASDDMLRQLFETIGDLFIAQNSIVNQTSIVQLAASELLLYIATVLRPKCLLDIPQIMQLLQMGPRFVHLTNPVVINIYISLISYLILPWHNVAEQQQDYSRRAIVLREYVECLAQNFLELDLNTCGDTKVVSTTLNLLSTCTTVIEFFKSTSNNAKEMLANTFKPIITKILMIFNNYGLSSITLAINICEFSLSILRTLPVQLGTPFIREMITLFITVSSREPLTLSRLAVMEKVLQMFKLIVEQPGNASVSLLPGILDFTTIQILPLLQQQDNVTDSTEITSLIYALFDSILNYKWQFFYKTQLNSQNSNENLHPDLFIAILNAYGQILVNGMDPNIVRSVLMSLQNVNERWRLYQRALFKDHLLASFERALINLLLNGEGALHFDLIANALYAMGQVNQQQLHESFAQAGLTAFNQNKINEICLTTDIPTFAQKLTQLMQDAHCVNLADT